MAARNQVYVSNAQVVAVEARQRPDGANMTVLTVTIPARNNGVTTLVVSSGAPAIQQKLQNIQQGMTVNLRANNLCAQKRQDGPIVGYAQLTHISLGVQGELADISLVAVSMPHAALWVVQQRFALSSNVPTWTALMRILTSRSSLMSLRCNVNRS